MFDGSNVLVRVCNALGSARPEEASSILVTDYPFKPLNNVGRHYSAVECMEVFVRDGFVDRYSGRRLVFPGTLRLISTLLPNEFPFQNNWKTDACHFAFYELFPTIDHLVPVSRGGPDHLDNRFSTSMVRNAAKANFTIEELGWNLLPPGPYQEWDGLTAWFLRQLTHRTDLQQVDYFRKWGDAARRILAF